jgi:hypothetical protein
MPTSPSYAVRFKWCALAATAITFLALAPQIHFWLVRGSQWHGAYTILQPDELLYSAYVNALIDGRPRRNDPVSGRDDHPEAPLPESLFSIQFIPPYAIAFLARAFGTSASTAFIVLMGTAGLLASLSVFWLLTSIMGDTRFAAIGVLVVLCFGAIVGGQGLIGLLLKPDVKFLGLPFLRGYEPSAPFPLFFVFCTLTWQALTTAFRRTATVKALLAGVTLGLLIFSYFYLWTAAAAWIVCLACLWILMRPIDRQKSIRVFIVIIAPVMLALAFYAYLMSQLPAAVDKAQVLTFTHRPDLLRIPEIIGAFILGTIIVGVRQKKISFSGPRVIFAASFALLPFLVFNQQLITGRSIQPFHYEILIANYVVLVSLVLVTGLLQPAIARRTTLLIVASCLLWGTIEVGLASHARYGSNLNNDQMVLVLLRLKEQATHDGTWEGLRDHGKGSTLVFSPEFRLSGLLPTWAPQGSLLATGSASFQSFSEAESKERLYTHFYYCRRDKEYVRKLLNNRADDPFGTYYARSVMFGPERVVTFLGQDVQPIRQEEIEHEVGAYETFASSFSREEAIKQPLTYAVVPSGGNFDFSNIDRWYERDGGQREGAFDLYRLKLREQVVIRDIRVDLFLAGESTL